MTYIYVLICLGSINCPVQSIKSSDVNDIYPTSASCKIAAPQVSAKLEKDQGGVWIWSCVKQRAS